MGREPRSESGTVLVEVTWLAILLLVPLVYVVLSVFEVQRAAFAATAAARAAGRAYVMAPSPAEAEVRARAAGAVALADQGVDSAATTLSVGCRPAGACLAPGSVVHVEVRAQVPLPLLPPVFGDQAPSIRVEAEHTVPYGTFREDRS
jgi:Flp pilus assembly protein TadG